MPTGPTYVRTKRSDLWTRAHLLQERPPQRSHWDKLHVWLQHQQPPESHRVARTYTEQLYKVPRAPPGNKRSAPTAAVNPCQCIPPCECQWELSNYRQPWTLSCLTAEPEENTEKPPDTSEGVQCSCIFPHECHWKTASSQPNQQLSLIRSFERLNGERCDDTIQS